jgi:hypothetical protein
MPKRNDFRTEKEIILKAVDPARAPAQQAINESKARKHGRHT